MRESEYHMSIGYDDGGYQPPELSSTNPYPDYIRKEAIDCAERIRKHQSEDTMTVGFMTDLHYDMNENHNVRMQRTVNAYKEIAARVPIDKLILGGDFTNDGYKSYKTECFIKLREHFAGVNYYPVHGNHDDGSIWDLSFIRAESSTNHLTHEELYHLFFNHLKDQGAELGDGELGLYYYCDDPVKKMRYIFLDAQDIPYIYDEKGKLKYTGMSHYAMSEKQLDWFMNRALRVEDEEYGILVTIHIIDLLALTGVKIHRPYLVVLNSILACYKKGMECRVEIKHEDFGANVYADFSKGKRGDLIGVLVGHYHRDMVVYGNDGFPYIFTGNSVMYNDGKPDKPLRVDGDKSELLFDVMTIDRKERKIYITRVGVGEDREIVF